MYPLEEIRGYSLWNRGRENLNKLCVMCFVSESFHPILSTRVRKDPRTQEASRRTGPWVDLYQETLACKRRFELKGRLMGREWEIGITLFHLRTHSGFLFVSRQVSHYVAQAGLEGMIYLPQHPEWQGLKACTITVS